MHGTDHITVHLKMCLSELICLLPHCNLLTSHLQTLTFWRRNHDDRLTLSQQTCPHARAHPDTSLARVFAFCLLVTTLITQSIWLVYTHKTYAKYQHRDKAPQADLPFAVQHLQCLMDIPASASSSLRQQHFLDHSSASLHSFLATALALAASAS